MDRRKISYKYVVCVALLALCCFGLVNFVPRNICAEEEIVFDKNVSYDVYYEVSEYEIDVLKDVKIVGIKTIGGVSFLTVAILGPTLKEGYILLSKIKAVMPAGSRKPERIFYKEK